MGGDFAQDLTASSTALATRSLLDRTGECWIEFSLTIN